MLAEENLGLAARLVIFWHQQVFIDGLFLHVAGRPVYGPGLGRCGLITAGPMHKVVHDDLDP